MKTTLNRLHVLCFIFLFSLSSASSSWLSQNSAGTRLLQAYFTSSSRYPLVAQTCTDQGYTRAGLAKSQGYQMSDKVATVNSSVGIWGTEVLRLFAKEDYSAARDKVGQNPNGYVGFFLTFAVALAVLILSIPCLLICCICSNSCPTSSCGRKQPQNGLQKNTLRLPLLILTIILILAITASIYGLATIGENKDGFKKATCAASIMTDNIMNGNTTIDGSSFFVGMNMLVNGLSYLNSNLTNIDNNLTQIHSNDNSTVMNQAISGTQTAQSDTIKVSNNDAAGTNLTLTYNTPIDNTVTTGTIDSTFPSVLGSFSSQTGLVWDLYTPIKSFYTYLTNFKARATYLHENIANQTAGFASATQSAQNLRNDVQVGVSDIQVGIDRVHKVSQHETATMYAFYIGVIVLSVLCAAFAIIAYIQETACCRRLMYFFCFFLFIFALFAALLATFYSLFLPVYAWSCNYYDQGLTSQFYFQNNFQLYFRTNALQKAGVCMPFGNGDILPQVASQTVQTSFDNLKNIFIQLDNFTITPYIGPMFTASDTALTTTLSYGLSQYMDITDSTSIAQLQRISSPSTGSFTNCNANLGGDSWVPSNNQNANSSTIIDCTITNGNVGNSSTCSSGLSSTTTCQGCMDSAEVLFRYLNPVSSLPTDLQLRYGSICSFNTVLNNIWNNYYKVKETVIGPTVGSTARTTGVYPRLRQVQTDLNNLNSTVDPALPAIIADIDSNLAVLDPLTNSTYGIFGGVNCSVVGEDAKLVRGTACGQAFDHVYYTRIVVGVISYLLLLALCFLVCFGNKHARVCVGEKYRTVQGVSPTLRPGTSKGTQQAYFYSHKTPGPNSIQSAAGMTYY